MLTLSPGSVCDVCAEEYNPYCVPHSIPCGHIFCWSCCHKIVQKTLPRLQAACPFCSDHFISDDVRLIRIDLPESGRVTPRWRGGLTETLDCSPSRREDRFPLVEPGFSRTRAETRSLEEKVAKVAARKCSVEEVSTLYKELEEWLTHDENLHVQLYSLSSSAALLRTILMNHIAHSEATKMAKGVEATLKGKLDDMELKVSKLETDLKQQQALHTQKVQECQALRAELTRYSLTKPASSRAANLSARLNTAASTGLSEHRQTVSSSAASPYKAPATPSSMLSRFAPTHSRSASASAAGVQKPTTSARMASPSMRSETPMQAPMMMSSRLHSSSIPPSKPSATSPQTINSPRSDNQERAREPIHKRWLPAPNVAHPPPTSITINYPPYFTSSPAPSRARASFSTKANATLPQIITPIQPDEDVWGLDDGWGLDEDVWELDEDGSELDEDGSELDEDGWGREPIHERWMPSPNAMADPLAGRAINYPPYFASFPPPGRARTSFPTNAATRLPQTITPVQQDEDGWERGRIRERWIPSPNASNVPTGKTVNYSSYFGSSPAPGLARASFSTYAAAMSPQTITSVHPDEHERGRKGIHERWMPSPDVQSKPPTGKTFNCPTYFGSSSAPGRTRF